jgi:hypothetical protein
VILWLTPPQPPDLGNSVKVPDEIHATRPSDPRRDPQAPGNADSVLEKRLSERLR